MQRAARIDADDVMGAGLEQDAGHGDPGRADAPDHDPQLVQPVAGELERVEQRGHDYHGGAVLVVVEDRECRAPP